MKIGCSTFILGAALGAGVALLFAPMCGELARNRIRQRSKEARDNATAKLEVPQG
jgi:gas vesicle protein